MKLPYNSIIVLTLAAFLFTCCRNDLPVSADEIEVEIDIINRDDNFQGPADGYIHDISLLSFVEKTPGDYYYAYRLFRIPLGEIVKEEDNKTGKRTIKATIRKMGGRKQKFALLANLVRDSMIISPTPSLTEVEINNESVSMQNALERYIYQTPTGWSATSGGKENPFPMFGMSEVECEVKGAGLKLIEINLYRMVAKVELFFHKDIASKLETGCKLHEAIDRGYISFNPGSDYMNDVNKNTKTNSELYALKAWMPTTTKTYEQSFTIRELNDEEKADPKLADCTRRIDGFIYLNETAGINYDPASKSYFEFEDKDGKSRELHLKPDLLRNCHYRFIVNDKNEMEFTADVLSWNNEDIKQEIF